jgi:hypothetical protein
MSLLAATNPQKKKMEIKVANAPLGAFCMLFWFKV